MPSQQLADEMTAAYRADTDRLGLGRPDHEPLASETIAAIIDLIQALIDARPRLPGRGRRLLQRAQLRRVRKALQPPRSRTCCPPTRASPTRSRRCKRDPLDFALWKAQKPGEDTAWDSPWGRGRPGWHIECSAMAETILGLDFDIHGGGSDLVFPHHENEIAQTEAGRGQPLARIWMHNGMIRFGEEKMAKSVGNIRTLADALDELRPRRADHLLPLRPLPPAARLLAGALEQAAVGAQACANFARLVAPLAGAHGRRPGGRTWRRCGTSSSPRCATTSTLPRRSRPCSSSSARATGGSRPGSALPGAAAALRRCSSVLGLERHARRATRRSTRRRCASRSEREQARLERDFARADALRDELLERG